MDLRREFIRDYVYECIKANCLYEGRYLLGTSMARPCIARSGVLDVFTRRASCL